MIEWYYILGGVSYAIFLFQFIASVFFGDIDFDLDVDADLSIGDLVSFKGLTHFLMGFSTWFMLKVTTGWINFVLAIVLGLIFMIILYYTYKLTLKLTQAPVILIGEDLVGKSASIYVNLGKDDEGMYKYIINVNNNIGNVEYNAKSDEKYSIGDNVVIKSFINGNYFI